jgi:hypothetical protein
MVVGKNTLKKLPVVRLPAVPAFEINYSSKRAIFQTKALYFLSI